jgi:hypothetical protein
MWQTDLVILMTAETTNNYGGFTRTWTPSIGVMCDVQDISKEMAYKNYGFEGNEFKQVFDTGFAPWVLGDVVRWDSRSWIVKLASRNKDKLSYSNHVYVILESTDTAVLLTGVESMDESEIMSVYTLELFQPTPVSEGLVSDESLIVGNLGLEVIVGD